MDYRLTKKEQIALEFAKIIASETNLAILHPDFKRDPDGGFTVSRELYFNAIEYLTKEFTERFCE